MSKKKALPVSDLLKALYADTPAYKIQADMLHAKIATAISTARIEKNMTQGQFADLMGVTQSQVSKWESEAYNFTIEKLCEITDKLGLELSLSIKRQFSIPQQSGNVTYLFSNPQSWTVASSYNDAHELKEM